MSGDNIDADKLRALEALLLKEQERRAREKPIDVIVTGVPRAGRDDDDYPPGATVIITGVPDDDGEAPPIAKAGKAPRVEDFGARKRVAEALSAVSNPLPSTPLPASALHAYDTAPADGRIVSLSRLAAAVRATLAKLRKANTRSNPAWST
jgi:hypothetical protein